jgi:hypothetical protein
VQQASDLGVLRLPALAASKPITQISRGEIGM